MIVMIAAVFLTPIALLLMRRKKRPQERPCRSLNTHEPHKNVLICDFFDSFPLHNVVLRRATNRNHFDFVLLSDNLKTDIVDLLHDHDIIPD